MCPKKVWYVEDKAIWRQPLVQDLRLRGFDVHAGTSIATSRDLLKEHAGTIDVAILDMRLEDFPDSSEPSNVGLNGADLGAELREAQRAYPPEFLVLSAYPKRDYFRAAIGLGIAEFLEKGDVPLESMVPIRYVRALALRRALSMERPDLTERVERIASESVDELGLIQCFLDEVLRPELANVLGAPFVLLFTAGGGSYCCRETEPTHEGPEPAYGELQELIYGTACAEPLTLYVDEFVRAKGKQHESALRSFEKGAFLPLTTGKPVRLSLGILPAPASFPLAEEPRPLARVLARYFRFAVVEQLLRLAARRRELIMERKTALAVAAAASRCCLYIGQEQASIIDVSGEKAEAAVDDPRIPRLWDLAHDLQEAGSWLATIGREAGGDERPTEALKGVPMAAMLREAWHCLCTASAEETGLPHVNEQMLELRGDCTVQGYRNDLLYAFTKLLQWFVERLGEETEPGPAVLVSCAQTARGPQVMLEDRSRRLPDSLRQELFMPFAQFLPRRGLGPERRYPSGYLPLHLSRMLIEFRHNGVLDDQSAAIPGTLGHRFLVRFPR